MFDIGFWEIVLISVIGLIVLGPERLPIAIRSIMRWITMAKGMANSVKTEISQELKLHELNENKREERNQEYDLSEQENPLLDSTKKAQHKQDKTDEYK